MYAPIRILTFRSRHRQYPEFNPIRNQKLTKRRANERLCGDHKKNLITFFLTLETVFSRI